MIHPFVNKLLKNSKKEHHKTQESKTLSLTFIFLSDKQPKAKMLW